MNPSVKDVEALVEAQARGETIEGVPVENNVLLEAELDARVSKLAAQPTGFLSINVEAQPSGFGE